MVYLPTFTMKINQMQVNIPYMDPMGIGSKSLFFQQWRLKSSHFFMVSTQGVIFFHVLIMCFFKKQSNQKGNKKKAHVCHQIWRKIIPLLIGKTGKPYPRHPNTS